MMHICVGNPTIIGSDNGLLSGQHQAIIWTNVEMLLNGQLEQTSLKSLWKFIHFHSRKCIWNYRLEIGGHFVSSSMC